MEEWRFRGSVGGEEAGASNFVEASMVQACISSGHKKEVGTRVGKITKLSDWRGTLMLISIVPAGTIRESPRPLLRCADAAVAQPLLVDGEHMSDHLPQESASTRGCRLSTFDT